MSSTSVEDAVAGLRAFNRFHSRFVGGLRRTYLGTDLTLQEARILWEVATRPGLDHGDLRVRLDLDQGYTSRLVARLRDRGLLRQEPSPHDGRVRLLWLTDAGRAAFRELDDRADAEAARYAGRLEPRDRRRLVEAMETVRSLLEGEPSGPPVRIREGRVGDLGWFFWRQAVVYHDEHGYGPVFETYVAAGLHPFLAAFDASRDRMWVAEADGRPVGCVAIQHDPDRPGWAKLRWYLVEAPARGRGVGGRLLDTALAFSREAGHDGVLLWTVDDLHAARRQYERAGFRLVEETDCPWKPSQRQQRWELRL